MFYFILFLVLVAIVGEIWSAFKMKKIYRSNELNKTWINPYKLRWLIGVPFAIGSYFITYTTQGESETYTIMGFPLMVAAFDEAGRDYVGPFTGPALFLNAAFWYFLPWIFLFIWALILKKTNLTSH